MTGTLSNLYQFGLVEFVINSRIGNSVEDRGELAKGFIALVSAIVSIFAAWVGANLTPVAAYLDDKGYWSIILIAWPIAWGFFQVNERRKASFITT